MGKQYYTSLIGKYSDIMRALLLFGLVLVASASALVEHGAGYHEEVGIPLAEKIRVAEEKMLAEAANNRIVGGQPAPANSHPYFVSIVTLFCFIKSELQYLHNKTC